MENLYLVFNRNEWELHRLAKSGFDFTDEELEAGLIHSEGYLGQRNGVGCYIINPLTQSLRDKGEIGLWKNNI